LLGADGGTIATSGIVPEVVMRLYGEFLEGRWEEARRIQFKLPDLINAMLFGTNFPEGFRAGMSLRGFAMGSSRQLLSPKEQSDLEDIRGKIACILADCGFAEAARSCRRNGPPPAGGFGAGELAHEVMKQLAARRAG